MKKEDTTHFYYVHFLASMGDGVSKEFSNVITTKQPIEYYQDVQAVQNSLVMSYKAEAVVIISWREIKGIERPCCSVQQTAEIN